MHSLTLGLSGFLLASCRPSAPIGDTSLDRGKGGASGDDSGVAESSATDSGAEDSGGGDSGGADSGSGDRAAWTGDLAELGPRLLGENATDWAGLMVRSAGDVDGDGRTDLLISAGHYSYGAGAVYVVTEPPVEDQSLSEATARIAATRTIYLGQAMDGLGDHDGDGYGDLVLGASLDSTTEDKAGSVWVFEGPLSGSMTPSEGDAWVSGQTADDGFGGSVAGVQDLDGDGHDEVLVGTSSWDNGLADEAGAATLWRGPLSESALAPEADLMLTGVDEGDEVGLVVRGLGDVDGDGLEDLGLIWGAQDGGLSDDTVDKAYGVLVVTDPVDGRFVAADVGDPLELAVASSRGASVNLDAAGDVDGDGYGDVAAGAYYLSSAGLPACVVALYPAGRSSSTPFRVEGDASGDGGRCGAIAAGAGDLDADGFDDLAIGAPEDASYSGTGVLWLVFGPVLASGSLDDAGVPMAAADGTGVGVSVAGVGDLDADGDADLLVGDGRYAVPGAALLLYSPSL